MSQKIQSTIPDSFAANTPPIELVTENEFSILRWWEIGGLPPPISGSYDFLVRNPQSMERKVAVEITDAIVMQIELFTRGRIRQGNSFWLCCAERHLAIYIWENDDYPENDKLRVIRLDPDDVITAIRWQIA
jgi:hypothetical protein